MTDSKTVLVGVSAGVAAYKTGQLVRDLGRAGLQVRVIPTPDSLNFVGVKTWQALSGHPVGVNVFDPALDHIELARLADAIVVAPATADCIAKIARGFANDLLTATILASSAPLVVAPAMHTQMWEAVPTQENIALLLSRGVKVVGPVSGDLASGDHGLGRMAQTGDILAATLIAVDAKTKTNCKPAPQDVGRLLDDGSLPESENICESAKLSGDSGKPSHVVTSGTASASLDVIPRLDFFNESKRILVTAGGSREPIDPVRFLGNRSSGLMGTEIAQQAAAQGAHVTLVAANLEVAPPVHPNIEIVQAPTAKAIYEEVLSRLEKTACLIMSAAVADFAPAHPSASKIEKTASDDKTLTLVLQRTHDVLKTVCEHPHRPQLVVGFGAQTDSLTKALEKGAAKARRKGVDILAVNLVGEKQGFGSVSTELYLLDSQGELIESINGNKTEVAAGLLARVARQMIQN